METYIAFNETSWDGNGNDWTLRLLVFLEHSLTQRRNINGRSEETSKWHPFYTQGSDKIKVLLKSTKTIVLNSQKDRDFMAFLGKQVLMLNSTLTVKKTSR